MANKWGRKLDFETGRVDMTHGSGGKAMAQLVDELFVAAFDNPMLAKKNDQALFEVPAGRMVMTTDGYVVSPIFFPGGDIGSLAVHGTINDVAMAGARRSICRRRSSSRRASRSATCGASWRPWRGPRAGRRRIVTGDTKVVERGKGDGVFISTTGVGIVPPRGRPLRRSRAARATSIIVSGTIGDHGVAILSSREGLAFETSIESDSAPLHRLVARMVRSCPTSTSCATPRAAACRPRSNEIARSRGVGMMVEERAIPVREEVTAACEVLGLDPLHLANEGKLVAICDRRHADRLLAAMLSDPLGQGLGGHRTRGRRQASLRPDRDHLRRQAHPRLARGGGVAPDLLTTRGGRGRAGW